MINRYALWAHTRDKQPIIKIKLESETNSKRSPIILIIQDTSIET